MRGGGTPPRIVACSWLAAGYHFSANGRRPCWAPGRAIFGFFNFFSDFFGTGPRLGPDFGPLSLQTLIFDGLWGRFGGVQNP